MNSQESLTPIQTERDKGEDSFEQPGVVNSNTDRGRLERGLTEQTEGRGFQYRQKESKTEIVDSFGA